MDRPKAVAVSGATGHVGRAVVRALLDAGYSVRGLVRDEEKASRVLPSDDGLRLVQGTVFNREALERLTDGVGAFVHTVGIIREAPDGQSFERIHVQGVEHVVKACSRAGVARFVHISALGVGPEGPTEYQRSKFEGERIVRRSGMGWTVLRPSLIHGADGEFVQQARLWVLGRAAPHLFVPYFKRWEGVAGMPPRPKLAVPLVQPVYVGDVAAAVVKSLQLPEAAGEVYYLGGPDRLTWPELIGVIRDAVPLAKRELPIIGMPDMVGAVIARTAKFMGLRDALPFDEGMARMAGRDSTCALDKAWKHLGFEPTPFRDAVASYADRL